MVYQERASAAFHLLFPGISFEDLYYFRTRVRRELEPKEKNHISTSWIDFSTGLKKVDQLGEKDI